MVRMSTRTEPRGIGFDLTTQPKSKVRTIIAGSREFTSQPIIDHAVSFCDWQITEVVCGCCPGVDNLGRNWANRNRIPVRLFPPNWQKHGKSAGPIRNSEMASYGEALIAIRLNHSRGTTDMIRKAIDKKLEVLVLDYKDEGSEPVKTRYHGGVKVNT